MSSWWYGARTFIDNAIPSGNSMAAELLLRLAKLTGNDAYRSEATRIFQIMASAMAQQPTGFWTTAECAR